MTVFRWVAEERPGPRWRANLDLTWPAYRKWFLLEGDDARPSLDEGLAALREHMPELVPLWSELVALAAWTREASGRRRARSGRAIFPRRERR